MVLPAPHAAGVHAPLSVVISDFSNGTGDTGLDRTLEPVIKLSLESAPFITAYARSDVRRALNVDPPDPFDERAANELAVKQGLGVVVAGTIERRDEGYRLQATARQAVTGKVVARSERDASARDGVLAAVGRLSEEIRQRLGDESSDAEQRFAMDTLTATSLEVVHDYAVAMEALSSSQFEAARPASSARWSGTRRSASPMPAGQSRRRTSESSRRRGRTSPRRSVTWTA